MAKIKIADDFHENESGVTGQYKNWFLDYASYVILERAVPAVGDGLKPVQRRILHAMKEMDDGRFNKVANIIGQSMQYHPHGDASIGEALVNMGQTPVRASAVTSRRTRGRRRFPSIHSCVLRCPRSRALTLGSPEKKTQKLELVAHT